MSFIEVDEHGVAHSIIGASSMARIDACAGSVKIHKQLLSEGWKGKSSPAANAGTAIHHFVEEMLINDDDPESYYEVYHAPTKYTVTKKDCANLAWVKKQVNRFRKMDMWKDAELHLEIKVHLSSVHPEAFGTTDICLIHPFGPALILDYKNGTAKVDAKGNRQMTYYGIGIQDEFGCTEVHMGILQPNVSKKPVELSLITTDDMETERQRLITTILKAEADQPALNSGSHCFFCPAKQAKKCPKLAEEQKSETEALLIPTDPEEVDELEWLPVKLDSSMLTPPSELSEKQIAQLLINRKIFEDYLKEVYDHAYHAFEEKPIRGFQIVEGRKGARKWTDDAEETLKGLVKEDYLYDTKLASPTTLSKRLGKAFDEIPSSLITQEPTSSKLVPIAEPRGIKQKTTKTK